MSPFFSSLLPYLFDYKRTGFSLEKFRNRGVRSFAEVRLYLTKKIAIGERRGNPWVCFESALKIDGAGLTRKLNVPA